MDSANLALGLALGLAVGVQAWAIQTLIVGQVSPKTRRGVALAGLVALLVIGAVGLSMPAESMRG